MIYEEILNPFISEDIPAEEEGEEIETPGEEADGNEKKTDGDEEEA